MPIYYFDCVNNTNDTAKYLVENYDINHGMVISDFQQKGRGRYGNSWVSIKGNFMGSLFFRVKNYMCIKNMQEYSLNLLLKSLKKIFKANIFQIKKPNDLLINKRKVSGILVESFKFKKNLFVIIGIGVNLIKNPKIKNYKTENLKKVFKKTIRPLMLGKVLISQMKVR